jgi:hypothetical protein
MHKLFASFLQYLIISVEEGCDPVNRVFYCDLEALPGGLAAVKGLLPVVKLIDNFEAQYGYIANDGTSFVFQVSFWWKHRPPLFAFLLKSGMILRHAEVCALI